MAGESLTMTQDEFDAKIAEAVDGLKKNRDELAKEAKSAKAALKNYEGVDPEEFRRLKDAAAQADLKKAAAEGDFNTLKAQLVENHGKELAGRDTKIGKLTKALEKRLVQAELRKAIADNKGLPDMADLLVEHGSKHVRVRETDDDFEAFVADEKGNPLYSDGAGTPMNIGAFVAQNLMTKYPRAFEGTGSSGGGASKSSDRVAGSPKVVAAGDQRAFIQNVAKIASGEVEVR